MLRRASHWPVALFAAGLAVAGDARAEAPLVWSGESASPEPIDARALTDREAALLAGCGAGDAALARVAASVVERKLAGLPYLDVEGLSFAQRVEGEPHVWPRAWVVSGRAMDQETARRQLGAWRASFHELGERRCGLATGVAKDGLEVIAAVALDALADLEPLPVRARVGQWLTVRARMLVPARSARVMLVGPDGEPRGIPTSLDAGRVLARFAPDRPGAFTVQVVAEVGAGPRPVLEARVFADVAPPSAPPSALESSAPGEAAGDGKELADERLEAMVSAARGASGLPRPHREPPLDAVARAHARRMLATRTVAHDVGEGGPAERLEQAGVLASVTGENVAHAASVRLAHRALWQSPSHRANLLRADWRSAGYAVAEEADGSAWVVELFAR